MRLDFNWERIFLCRIHYSVDGVFKNQKRVEDSFHVTAKRITLLAPRRQNSPWFWDTHTCGSMEGGLASSQVSPAENRIPLGSVHPSWVCNPWRNPGCPPERLTALTRNLVKRRLLTLSLCIRGADWQCMQRGHWLWTRTQGWTTDDILNKTQMCTVFSEHGNTRHFDLLLGAQFKWKLWSWESFSGVMETVLDTHYDGWERQWWEGHDGM